MQEKAAMVSKSLTMGKSEHVSKQKTIQMQLCDIISTSITMEGKEWQKKSYYYSFSLLTLYSTTAENTCPWQNAWLCSAKDEFLISTNFSQDPFSKALRYLNFNFYNISEAKFILWLFDLELIQIKLKRWSWPLLKYSSIFY